MTGIKVTLQEVELNTQQQGVATKMPVYASITNELPATYILANDATAVRGIGIKDLKALLIIAIKGKIGAALISDVLHDPLSTAIPTAYADLVNPIV